MRFSLRTRILLLIAGTLTGLAALIVVAITLLARQEMNRTVRADVRATGGVLAQFLRDRSDSLQNQSRQIARQPVLKGYIQDTDRATLKDLADDYRQALRADGVALTDRDGRLLGETGVDPENAAPSDRAGEPGVAAAMSGTAWSGVEARGGALTLSISVPITIGPEVWGTLTAYSAINDDLAHSLKTALASGSDVAFVSGGRVEGASLPLPPRLSAPRAAPRLVTIEGAQYFALYAPLPGAAPASGMGFIVLRPYHLAMATYTRFRNALGLLFALALLLALGAGTALSRSLTRPLDGVVRAAQIVREGGWPERFDVRRNDEIGLLQTVFNDMTQAVQASQERLLALIDTDPLTGLDNHRRFQERLAQEAKRWEASEEPLSLLLFDLDHFLQYNQRYGHAAGDAALQKVALLLQNCLPEVAITARYAGEQFTALLPQHTLDQAEALGDQVRKLFAGSSDAENQDGQPPLTLSAGCAAFGAHTRKAEGLTLAAELAVSQAKQLGRNRVCRFDSVPGADENADPYQLHQFLKDGSFATIRALAAAVDAKDPYTEGHSQRVAQYASDLARYIGLPAEQVDLIQTTGTLHDVGKIGVPDAILKKPGRLDDDEREIMETHPILGEVIVRKAPQLAATLPGVRNHHERWDGKGYPDRLAGAAIPLMARILAVADTFDAMTSDRPYRKGLSVEIALAEIAKGSGTQFDPALSAPFVAMMETRGALPRAA